MTTSFIASGTNGKIRYTSENHGIAPGSRTGGRTAASMRSAHPEMRCMIAFMPRIVVARGPLQKRQASAREHDNRHGIPNSQRGRSGIAYAACGTARSAPRVLDLSACAGLVLPRSHLRIG